MTLTERFDDALLYASKLHHSQFQKGTEIPYMSHLLMVAAIVLGYGGSEDEAIAALLHDAVEDAGGEATLREIQQRFGQHVAEIVDGCTDTDVVPKPPWRARKEKYISHLETATRSTLFVSAADKMANVGSLLKDYRAVGEALWSRFNGGREGTLWYYRSLADVFLRLGPHPLAERLSDGVTELEKLASAGE